MAVSIGLEDHCERFPHSTHDDLIQSASSMLDFLELVDAFPGLHSGPILRNAIRRYEVFWLPLAAKQRSGSNLLVAPLDIAWVWHVHMLASHHYEEDCINIVSQVVDHMPMNRYQRQDGIQKTKRIWEIQYPGEPFEVDLTRPTQFFMPYKLKIRYNLEKACYDQFKFYYQVSWPHYTDRKFLTEAVERYEHHLQLKIRNPNVFMVPSCDVDLIWRAHLQLPLNYKTTTANMFGNTVQRNDQETILTMGSMLSDSETSTTVWRAAGLQFDKPGTMFRGEPPPSRPPRPDWYYASLARLQYVMSILRIEVLNADITKTFYVRLFDPNSSFILSQGMKGGCGVDLMNQCALDNENKHSVTVALRQKTFFGDKAIGSARTSLLSYLDSFYVGKSAPAQPWIIDVPFNKQIAVRLTITFTSPVVEGYRFTIRPEPSFTKDDHPSLVLSFPKMMFTPRDFAERYLPCESATHSLLDVRKRETFKCRVVHSTAAIVSAVEIINLYNVTVASAHTINAAILPGKGSVEDEKRCIVLNQMEGERAMLIRGRKDWGICVGKWQKGKRFKRSAGKVEITFFSIQGARGWCEVRKYKEGLYLIYIDSNNYVYVDLKRGIFVVSPAAQDIPEIIAAAFSVSILYLLCKPYTPTRSKESSPSLHKKAKSDKVFPMLLASGYSSTSVPTNVYLGPEVCGPTEGSGCYDLDSESGSYWSTELQARGALYTQEASLWFKLTGVKPPTENHSKDSRGSSGRGIFSGGFGGGIYGGGSDWASGGGGGGGDGGGC